MKPPKPSENSEPDLAQELEEVEQWLRSLQERYHQVQRDQQQKAEWQEKLQQLQDNQDWTAEVKSEIQRIQQQLLMLETNLESQLFSWTSLKRPFWQIIRFGGLGVVIGWLLRSCVGE
jgi:predicted RNase H-like nuclease (RuvC/YqgF family)